MTYIKFKAYFEGDVRRFSFENIPSFLEFSNKLRNIYSLSESDDIHVTYKDDTNDNISITNVLDFEEALNFYKHSGFDILRLFINLKDNKNLNKNLNNNQSNSNNNNNKKNVGDLENLFVSLLSNQMIQQMIPQVINGLASNPSIMTSIIQTAGNSFRSQSIQQNNSLNNNKSPNTFHTQSTDSIVLALPKLSGNTTTTTTTTSTLKKSTDEIYSNTNTMITSSSSSSSLLDMTKSFEEIDSSPIPTSIAITTSNSNNGSSVVATTNVNRSSSPHNEKEKKSNPNILSQVPKIFQNIHLPFSSTPKTESPNNSVIQFKKEDTTSNTISNTNTLNNQQDTSIQSPIPVHEYVPPQIYPVTQPMPYSSPNFSYHLPTNSTNTNTGTPNPQPYQPPQPYTNTTNNQPAVLIKPTAPIIPLSSIPPMQPQPQPVPQEQQQPENGNIDEQIKFIKEALGLSSEKASELLIQHKGNVYAIFESQN